MRNFWILAIIFTFTFFISACNQKEDLKTSLENNEVTMTIGEEINVEVFTEEGLDVIWETEDAGVVSVEKGTFSAVGEGTTYVIVKSGDLETKIKVTVIPKAVEETFTITWLDRDGTVLEVDENVLKGTMPSFDGHIPPHDGLEFKGWDPEVVPVEGDATYTATYKADQPTYVITWKHADGQTLTTSVVYGTQMPVYPGPVPTKESDDYYDYMFTGWSPKLGPANHIRTYTAQFTGIRKIYTVTWEHPLNGVIYTETINAGDYAVYNGAEPTFPDDKVTGVRKKFYGWSPNANNTKILKNTTFLAEFREVHKITWMNEGVILQEGDVFKGDTPEYNGAEPTRPRDSKYLYTFKNWSPAIDVVKNVDVVYDATYDCFSDPSKEFEFEESWTYGGLQIVNYKLKDSGTEVVIPLWYNGERITQIGYNAFKESQKLKKVTISDGLLWINSGAFEDCIALEEFKFGPKITHIEHDTFSGCTALSFIDIDAPIVEIKMNAFNGCTNLENVEFPQSLEMIRWGAFEDCIKLDRVHFPESLQIIDTCAFASCTNLVVVQFAQNSKLEYIGGSAFSECTSLLTIEIPGS
ncbi:MAG TPA: leucine-rich repeat domain-containing protein, partial [Bacilli bacterium]|nr:leucine-rich repeat domain-containing protein [Bacilli bacterium]